MKQLYLLLNESNNKVTGYSFDDGQFYQEVPDDFSIDDAVEQIGINDLYWEGGMLVHKEPNEIDRLKAQIKVLTEQTEFQDDLIQELAMMVYA